MRYLCLYKVIQNVYIQFYLVGSQMTQTVEVELTTSPVELYKILKFEGIASSGAEAKMLIDQGMVMVNGETETRKRRKIVADDEISFEDITLIISA